jgi:hypothetical protein
MALLYGSALLFSFKDGGLDAVIAERNIWQRKESGGRKPFDPKR